MSKPSLVFIHGSWHRAEHFGPLMEKLKSHKYKCVAVNLPSTQSPDLPPATLTDDVKAVRSAVIGELDQGNDVVVVAHSYGGHVANRAMGGFDRKSRTSSRASTAVLAMAFLCAIPLPAGSSFLGGFGGKPAPCHDRRTEDFVWVNEPGPEHYFYNDLLGEEAKKWSELLEVQSWVAYCEELPHAGYMDIPSAYLYCTKDNILPYEIQQGIVKAGIDAGAQFGHMETMHSSHSPFLSMPKQTAEFIRRVAGEDVN